VDGSRSSSLYLSADISPALISSLGSYPRIEGLDEHLPRILSARPVASLVFFQTPTAPEPFPSPRKVKQVGLLLFLLIKLMVSILLTPFLSPLFL